MDRRYDDVGPVIAKAQALASASGLSFHSALAIVRAQLGLEVI